MKNKKSIQLIKDFTAELLGGDIANLVTFDIKQLRGNKKYGGCNGSGFDSDNTNIVRAILAVAFEDVWPDFDEDSLNSKDYRGDTMNTFNTMFGPPMPNGGFQGFNIFAPKNHIFERVWQFYHTYTTIGNFVVLPNKAVGRYTLNTFRGTYSKWRDYFDQFLYNLRNYLVEGKSENGTFSQLMDANKGAFTAYKGKDGFISLCRKLLLDDNIDSDGNVRNFFLVVYWWNKSTAVQEYIHATCNYLDYCEPLIINRDKRIVEILKKKVNSFD